jgi:hypothetical protein
MKAEIFPITRRTGVVTQEAQNELLIYDLETNQAFCLNQTSALVYEMCDGTKSVTEIGRSLRSKLKSEVSEEVVWLALDQLKKEKLIENSDEVPHHFTGMNRREVIKKVGLGSMVALPIVASLIAPKAIHAQSDVCVPGTTCNCICDQAQGGNAPGGCNTIAAGEACPTLPGSCGTTGCVCRKTNNGNVIPGTCQP